MKNWNGLVTIFACILLVLISLISAAAWECEGKRHHDDDEENDDDETGDDGNEDEGDDGSEDGDGSGDDEDDENGDSDGEEGNTDGSPTSQDVDRIHGHVLNSRSEPLADAKILIEGNGGHRVSHSYDDGYYSIMFGQASPEPRMLKVTLDGYSPFQEEVIIDGQTHLNITLVREPSVSPREIVPDTPWMIVLGIVAMIGGAAIMKKREGIMLSFLFSPLYTKLGRERILDHDTRREIFDFIRENPGANYAGMKQELGLQTSSTVHHLRVLEREGYIRSTKELGRRLFYPKGSGPVPFEGYASRPLSPIQEQIIGSLAEAGPQTSRELGSRLELRRSSLHYSLRRLEERNLIMGEKIGRVTRYSPMGESWDEA